ncbi:hypothetical protein MKX01_000627 [Papaver californicum]|nr:hypothetical protein MKX01_000627 [Papaver californicum]
MIKFGCELFFEVLILKLWCFNHVGSFASVCIKIVLKCRNISLLEFDIFEEIRVMNSTVNVILHDPSPRTNATNVLFAEDPVSKDRKISPAGLSLLRASFVSLITQQSSLHLIPSLFSNNTSSFGVLKLKGGVTVTPPQNAFLHQKVQHFLDGSGAYGYPSPSLAPLPHTTGHHHHHHQHAQPPDQHQSRGRAYLTE